ncbi:dimethyladenosine transferase 1, mitochondrial-like [Amphiura filiformis]|uniref:dimethyladenosine transferase 1, mitochondrial-like n=1 Tax=Amphiura filiformis TaxID=82378 RepID=UPI003B21E42A
MNPLRLPPLPTLREIIRLYGLRAEKQLAQNFILDLNLTDKIVKYAGKNLEGAYVCEVGPGPGGITRSILNRGASQVVVVEKDKRFMPSLQMLAEASEGRLQVFNDDILKFNMENIFPEAVKKDWHGEPINVHIIGNLPFNVSTPLIIRWLAAVSNHSGPFVYGRSRMLLTFQKEVAERLTAPPNHPQRSRPSVMAQHLCHVKHCFTIPGKACVPTPDVDIGVVHFTPLKEPLIKLPFHLVEKVVRSVFHFRQKYCRKGVEILFPYPMMKELTNEMFESSGVDPTRIAPSLSMEEINGLCLAYSAICDRIPGLIDYNYR